MLDDGAARSEASPQHRDAALRPYRIVERTDDIVVVDLRSRDILAQSAPGYGPRLQIKESCKPREEGSAAASVEEIFHQEFAVVRAQIGDQRDAAADGVETIQIQAQ